MDEKHGRVRFTYTSTRWDGPKHRAERVARLHLPPGALTFASRKAYRLGYRSQRETPRDRALGRAFKLRRRLGSHEGIGQFIAKPKGMRWRTFDREMAKVEAAEATLNRHAWLLLQSLNRRLPTSTAKEGLVTVRPRSPGRDPFSGGQLGHYSDNGPARMRTSLLDPKMNC